MTEQALPPLDAMSGVEQLKHLDHPDHPVHVVHKAVLVDFKEACGWHDRIHADALAENYDLGHEHG